MYDHEHLMPTVKHGGRGVMTGAWFAAKGPGQLQVIKFSVEFSIVIRYSLAKLSHSIGQQSKAHEQIYKRMAGMTEAGIQNG